VCAPAESAESAAGQTRTGAPAVLIVEDEAPLRELLAELLREEGYHVAEAADGVEALRILESRDPARSIRVVLLDMMLPHLDGAGVLRYLAARGGETPPVIAMSASNERLADARAAGAHLALVKPLDLDQLLDTVARYCA
jgi:two-component system response regulator MprA